MIAAGIGRKPGMLRMDLLNTNAIVVKNICRGISRYCQNPYLIVVTNPLDPLTYLTLKMIGSDRKNVMGMAGLLDLSRFKEYISSITNISRSSIQAMVISEHGENMPPLARFSSISGIPLLSLITENQADELVVKTRQVATDIISFKGATAHGPGNAVSALIEAIARNQRAVIPVSTLLDGEYGYYDVCIGVPCIIGSKGIEEIIELSLNQDEAQMFSEGVRVIKTAIKRLHL